MKQRMWITAVAVCLLATVAVAGTMTQQELTTKISNCPSCKALANYPELMPNLRPDIFATETGFVSTFLVADAKVLPSCEKWQSECEATVGAMAKSSPDEVGKTYCPVCLSFMSLYGNKDVKMENFKGSMGSVTVASSTTKAGVDALHAHVALMTEAKAAMPAAMAEIMKTSKAKTAASGE